MVMFVQQVVEYKMNLVVVAKPQTVQMQTMAKNPISFEAKQMTCQKKNPV